jgi:hypothetical protein
MARYYSGKFPGAKKYRNCTFKHILEVMQDEIKTMIFDSITQHQTTEPKITSALVILHPLR